MINKINSIKARLITRFYYKYLFKSLGEKSRIFKPLFMNNTKYISIGSNVLIRNNLRVETINKFRIPILEIGNNVNIEQNVHIICSNKVKIGDNCSITANCTIIDTEHPYEDVECIKIGDLLSENQKEVIIGNNCFMGIGSIVFPGVELGEHCVIGANSVVTKSFPAYSVIAGNPARMIKRYDLEKKIWRKTDKNGEFTDEI
jgi:acetyltransferase-like isoleucine patch superfamily enzyme